LESGKQDWRRQLVRHVAAAPLRTVSCQARRALLTSVRAWAFADLFHSLERDKSYELFLNEDGNLRWRGEENGQEVILSKEPQTSWYTP
jgi:hypothetical protein